MDYIQFKKQARPGDILFYKPKWTLLGWFIVWAQNVIGKSPISDVGYCHVALIDEDTDYMLESTWPKSRRTKINWDRLKKKYDLELWRVQETSPEKVDKVIEWAHSHLGEYYDLGLFIWGMFDFKHREVCSTFVTKAWKVAGVEFKISKIINKNTTFLTPDELAAQKQLMKITAT